MFNEIRRALSGKSLVSVQVLLKVNYCLKYSYACSTVQIAYLLPQLSLINIFIYSFVKCTIEVNAILETK